MAIIEQDKSAVGIRNEVNALIGTIAGDGVKGPVSNCSYTAGSAGALTGTYRWNVTFVTADGETAPWYGTPSPLVLSAQRANLTSIPIGAAGTIARRIYRTKANAGEPKNVFFVAEIADNTSTTYTDNALDAALGSPVAWVPTNFGFLENSFGNVISFGDSITLGANAKAGYASIAIGGNALASQSGSFRNVAVGIYALTAVTTGVENIGIGTHAAEGVVAGAGNTVVGTYAMMLSGAGGNQSYNIAIGHSALGGFRQVGYGSLCVAIGYRAMYYGNTADNVIAIGPFAGQWSDASGQVFIDSRDRGSSLPGYQDVGLIYGKTAAGTTATVAGTQDLRLNAPTRIGWGSAVVANLPAASAALKGYRAYVTDASVVYSSANLGSTVAGGGSNCVPVFCNGTNWVIG